MFNAGASAYTISVPVNLALTISGAGIVNNSGITQNFAVGASGAAFDNYIIFENSASAGSNTSYTIYGGNISSQYGGELYFYSTSTAGNATIANNGAAASGFNGGYPEFQNTSTGGNATLIANGGSNGGGGGAIYFVQQSTGGAARVILNGFGFLDISGPTAPATSVTVGSIEGSGNVFLGAYNPSATGSPPTPTTTANSSAPTTTTPSSPADCASRSEA
jgi:hypothetical protein